MEIEIAINHALIMLKTLKHQRIRSSASC